mmetsp:Transcript_16609/g.45744  ORF Transcript_16609/g.45744 Transcript_16609/m.45744 type:complete len:219 (-) Transcript_16609:301-957(-)
MAFSHQCNRCHVTGMTALINVVLFLVLLSGGINEAKGFSVPLSSVLTTSVRRNTNFPLKTDTKVSLISVTDSNYRELFSGDKYLLLDACAQWCGPCKLIEPLLEQCADDWKETVVVGKFDVDDANGQSRNLKVELILHGAMPQALPALILIHNNKILDTWKGVISPVELQEMLEKFVVTKKLNVQQIIDKAPKKSIAATNEIDPAKPREFRGIRLIND